MPSTYTPDSLRRARRLAAMMSLVAAVAACDNPVTPDQHEEEVHGVAVLQGEIEVARYFDGELTGELPDVVAGEEGPLLTIAFLDHDGEAVDLGAEEDVSLRARVAHPTIAGFTVDGFAGRVQGVAEGATTVVFDLMHGDHADFSTVGIPVTVLAAP